ncbi:MAG TPA: cytochrome c oxidase subunit 4 [Acidimicrobiales bacterium]
MAERPIPGTEGPRGHELRPPVDDRRVPLRVFAVVGVALLVIASIYAATSYEESGIVMLFLAAGLALWTAAYLWLQQRPRDHVRPGERVDVSATVEAPPGAGRVETNHGPPPQEERATAAVHGVPVADRRDVAEAVGEAAAAEGVARPKGEPEEYLPHASLWPFAIGLGSAGIAVGLVLGIWVAAPGAALLALGVGGFVRQTRRRD